MNRNIGDRECPECETMSLIEKGSAQWACLNCKETFDDKYIDCGEE